MPQSPLRILFIDDDPDVLATVPTDIKATLSEKGVVCKIVKAETLDEGLERLSKDVIGFHVAVVDLRLGPGSQSGNTIIAKILETKVLPIIVYSGYREDLEVAFRGHGLIYVSPSNKKPRHITEQLLAWYRQHVFAFFSETGFLNSSLRTVLQQTMWNHVSRYWEHLSTTDVELLSRTAGRIAATLLHDVLISSPAHATESGEVLIRHGEIYIFDTPRRYLATGDILRINEVRHMVLSPSCDLVYRPNSGAKAEKVLLACCRDFAEFAEQSQNINRELDVLSDKSSSKSKIIKAEDKLERLMRQDWENPSGRYFYLPPFADFDGGVIDFLATNVELYDDERRGNLLDFRELSLNRDMASEVAARFARYMIRLGQAPYETNGLIETINRVWSKRKAK